MSITTLDEKLFECREKVVIKLQDILDRYSTTVDITMWRKLNSYVCTGEIFALFYQKKSFVIKSVTKVIFSRSLAPPLNWEFKERKKSAMCASTNNATNKHENTAIPADPADPGVIAGIAIAAILTVVSVAACSGLLVTKKFVQIPTRCIGVCFSTIIPNKKGYTFSKFNIGYIVYRHFLHRNLTSMNFDNPVYRKTTEDQFALEKNQFQPQRIYPATVGEEKTVPNLKKDFACTDCQSTKKSENFELTDMIKMNSITNMWGIVPNLDYLLYKRI
uniref:Uncharacterized protein n=1 Tax=Timema bartmani TaxID=61472 RepID=A0A7R9EUP6_9NEOP|nr:unnamed protein product [Timema bartmani]